MPFYPLTLTLASQVASVILTAFIACCIFGRREAVGRLLDFQKLRSLWPLGLIYGIGDFCQTIACSSASGTMVVIVAQSKLLVTAALSRALMGPKRNEQWEKLAFICVAAVWSVQLRVHATAAPMQRAGEILGATLALAKAVSSALGAVISEIYYKQIHESFWILSTRVQALMLFTSLGLYVRELLAETMPWSLSELAWAGPNPICSFGGRYPKAGGCDTSSLGTCQCVTHSGWDLRTGTAMLAIATNGLVTGLTLRYLSAVGKSICNVLGLVAFYFIYVGMGLENLHWWQVVLVFSIVFFSFQYAKEKQRQKEQQD